MSRRILFRGRELITVGGQRADKGRFCVRRTTGVAVLRTPRGTIWARWSL